eukprot:7067731-Alexandrium_andersonii.AAC.1
MGEGRGSGNAGATTPPWGKQWQRGCNRTASSAAIAVAITTALLLIIAWVLASAINVSIPPAASELATQ